jgi:hypothetical protein
MPPILINVVFNWWSNVTQILKAKRNQEAAIYNKWMKETPKVLFVIQFSMILKFTDLITLRPQN